VQIGDLGSAKKEILQNVEFVHGGENQKRKVLAKLLSKYRSPPIMIFVN
jgi:superfamily II DNA/RNA helicase